jgi:hypothetical protein
MVWWFVCIDKCIYRVLGWVVSADGFQTFNSPAKHCSVYTSMYIHKCSSHLLLCEYLLHNKHSPLPMYTSITVVCTSMHSRDHLCILLLQSSRSRLQATIASAWFQCRIKPFNVQLLVVKTIEWDCKRFYQLCMLDMTPWGVLLFHHNVLPGAPLTIRAPFYIFKPSTPNQSIKHLLFKHSIQTSHQTIHPKPIKPYRISNLLMPLYKALLNPNTKYTPNQSNNSNQIL